MFKRAIASRHTAHAEQQQQPLRPAEAGPRAARSGMTRAQAKALSRCAPLTPGEFKARRRVAEQGLISLRGVLDEGPPRPTSTD